MNNWMNDCHDWCISRQLWWGHRIPAWYKDDEIYVGIIPPKEEGWRQDEDVLDTWFSSALWPFSTMGWPYDKTLYDRYFPTNVLVTGYDIIFFWVCRMTFQSLEFTDKRPFEYCLIHGLIRDKQGRKMSKSLGNGVDPMDMIDKYGADSLRYYLTTSTAPGMDLRFDEDKIKSTWNFINKLWNASRFVLMNTIDIKTINLDTINNSDKYILSKLNQTIKDVTKEMDKFMFNNVNASLYSFIWEEFCDNYIEMAKFSIDTIGTKSTLLYTLTCILKMLHPFMPYVTEEIYGMLPVKQTESIMISTYPKVNKNQIFNNECNEVEKQLDFISKFRNTLKENNIFGEYQVKLNFNNDLVIQMLKLKDRLVNNCDKTPFEVKFKDLTATIYYEKIVTEEEKKLKEKQISELQKSILKRENLLNNENFIKKAPANLVENEKNKLQEEKELLATLTK